MSRPPAYLTLSQAVSWMAFGQRLDQATLKSKLAEAYFGVDRATVFHQLESAVKHLGRLGHAGQVEMQGRWTEPLNPTCSGVYTVIPAIKLADFMAFDSTTDGMRRGEGILWWHEDNSHGNHIAHDGFYSDVLVKATDLQKHFRQPLCQQPKLPSVPQADLKRWFNGLPKQAKSVPAVTLWAMAKTAHPNHSVPRRMMQGLRTALPPGRPKNSPQI